MSGPVLVPALAQAAVLASVPAASSAASLPPQSVYEGCAPGTSATSLRLSVSTSAPGIYSQSGIIGAG